MPRLVHRHPKYQHHKASGQAIVTLNGQDIYLGPHDTEESRREYDRVIGQWLASGRQTPAAAAGLYIAELALAYSNHADAYYRRSKGERAAIASALTVLLSAHAATRAADFGPVALRAVREAMVARGWCRNYVNQEIGRLRQMFKWAVERELVPAQVLLGLQSVVGLKRGRSQAPESDPVTPVADAHVDATVRCLPSRQLRAMVELQRLTGMRPGEVCAMRTRDLDTAASVWTYRPAAHKTDHHGHDRIVYLGPRAQQILAPWLRPDLDAHLFQPAEAEAQRLADRHAARKTPAHHGNRPGTHRRRRPRRQPGDRYTVDTYRRAIARACEIAFAMPESLRKAPSKETAEQRQARRAAAAAWRKAHCWHPHQLRHTAATNLRRDYGLEAAQVILGHKTLTVTQVYAEKNVLAAQRIMGEVG